MIPQDHKTQPVNNKELVPFEHYKSCFKALDPQEAAKRCGVSYDESGFEFRLLNECYKITWPEFSISSENPSAGALNSLSAQMLIIRYLLEGRASVGSGKFVTYREMPWGEVYVRQFTGRCITRAAFSFATRMQAFEKTMETLPVVKTEDGDLSCRFELIPGYEIRLILWEGDEEFPPNAQILFSDNFPMGFTAEDICVACDTFIGAFKKQMNK